MVGILEMDLSRTIAKYTFRKKILDCELEAAQKGIHSRIAQILEVDPECQRLREELDKLLKKELDRAMQGDEIAVQLLAEHRATQHQLQELNTETMSLIVTSLGPVGESEHDVAKTQDVRLGGSLVSLPGAPGIQRNQCTTVQIQDGVREISTHGSGSAPNETLTEISSPSVKEVTEQVAGTFNLAQLEEIAKVYSHACLRDGVVYLRSCGVLNANEIPCGANAPSLLDASTTKDRFFRGYKDFKLHLFNKHGKVLEPITSIDQFCILKPVSYDDAVRISQGNETEEPVVICDGMVSKLATSAGKRFKRDKDQLASTPLFLQGNTGTGQPQISAFSTPVTQSAPVATPPARKESLEGSTTIVVAHPTTAGRQGSSRAGDATVPYRNTESGPCEALEHETDRVTLEQFQQIQKLYSHVCLKDGIVYLRSCGIPTDLGLCGANAPNWMDSSEPQFFRGDRGFKGHFVHKHGRTLSSTATVDQYCILEPVAYDDALQMSRGKRTTIPITIRYGTASKPFKPRGAAVQKRKRADSPNYWTPKQDVDHRLA